MALHDVTSATLMVQANLVGVQPLSWLLGLGQQNQHTLVIFCFYTRPPWKAGVFFPSFLF